MISYRILGLSKVVASGMRVESARNADALCTDPHSFDRRSLVRRTNLSGLAFAANVL